MGPVLGEFKGIVGVFSIAKQPSHLVLQRTEIIVAQPWLGAPEVVRFSQFKDVLTGLQLAKMVTSR
jgi:hypothetical protein